MLSRQSPCCCPAGQDEARVKGHSNPESRFTRVGQNPAVPLARDVLGDQVSTRPKLMVQPADSSGHGHDESRP